MASAAISNPESKEFSPRSSLSIEAPASSSPYPSPGSSFLPPPVPGVHEFAKPPTRNSTGSTQKGKQVDGSEGADKQVLMDGNAGEDASRTPGKSQLLDLPPDSPAASPITPTLPTPTPASVNNTVSGTKTPTPSSPLVLDIPGADMGASALSASRPAPPSPAPSRRSSAVMNGSASLSRHSSKSSTRPSLSGSANRKSQSRLSQLSSSLQYFTPSSSPAQSIQLPPQDAEPDPPKAKRHSLFLAKIRDFAYPASDDRHCGKGPDVPRPNRYPKRMSTLSYASSSSSEDEEDDVSKAGTWGGFKWGFGGGGWGFGNRGSRMPGEEDLGSLPSRTELDRNFTGEDEDEEEGYGDAEGEEGPLYPGLYKALYAFMPEGTAEMALEEEQVVRVISRGGVGWAIVLKPEGGQALVPASYLEPVKLDEEEE
ncbi:hypothetical protein OE88DRAFT_1239961 [Heliocybe sulcata]|uniref:SH3 domain-containing protein n=1 Tax=Heliocybe sulcata TaxID=5364 RepID=A0A5C3N8Y6_9AGAM|nr:hypothetical protein OE88DRAFT_1239961 [Heliocybe sulcata]